MIFQVQHTMGPPLEINSNGTFPRQLRRLVATSSIPCRLQFPGTGRASLIHRCASRVRSYGMQLYSECRRCQNVERHLQ